MKTCAATRTTLAILLLLPLAVGCKTQGRPQVQGKVTYQGNPVAGQTLTLRWLGEGNDAFDVKIPLQTDGSFARDVPLPGKYKVVIEPSRAAQESRAPAEGAAAIPPKFRSAATSDLVWTIEPGENKWDIDLKD